MSVIGSNGFPDWKKIGKKLRDILNPPAENGPSDEERRAQRLQDGLKGFVYLDNFDELEGWSLDDVDPIQIANTPLLKRSASSVHDQSWPTSSVLLCHDYGGGYQEYEGVRPHLLVERPYSCKYLQYIDKFIYFSHKLVCVPPPAWTNTLHRNGVESLGTFMIESDKVSVARMLEQEDGDFVVAKQLAVIADAYGFDGWLLNIEAEFPLTVADPIGKATAFIRNLKRLLGTERLVIWYDAVNTDNEVDYQNGLTEKNVPFALAADSLFTNYKWTQAKIDQAKISSQWNGILPSEVRFGVDVWAQNTDMPPPARVTFPAKGGGGTNTGVAVRKLAENDFSTAIFAPAWTHEHFSTASHESIAASVERSMWEGLSLPSDLHCECTKGKPHHTLEYRSYPLVRSAREYPVGSSVFFSTDFRPAIPLADDGQYLSHLGSQAVQPHILPVSASDIEAMRSGPETRILYAEPPSAKTSGLTIRTKILGHDDHAPNLGRDPATKSLCRLCVFKVNMLADGTLEATFKFRAGSKRGQALIGFYTIYASQSSHELECKNNIIHYPSPDKVEHKTINISNDTPDSRLIELGVFCEGHNGIARHEKLLEIFDITVKSKNLPKVRWIIDDLHVTSHSNPETTQKRLKWRWTGPSDFVQSELLPWSKTTGPFSHFVISIAGAVVGEAYCHEFPLRDADFDKVQGDKTPRKEGRVEVLIQGVLFGGGSVRSEAMMISREEGSLGYE